MIILSRNSELKNRPQEQHLTELGQLGQQVRVLRVGQLVSRVIILDYKRIMNSEGCS